MNRLLAIMLVAILLGLPAQGTVFDWRYQPGGDFTTPVKSQGGCGSCWAFAVVAALESKFEIANQDAFLNLDLSEQHLIMEPSGGGDCSGGVEFAALAFLREHGITQEATLPYTASNSSPAWPLNGAYDLFGVDAFSIGLRPGYDGGDQPYSTSNIKAALEQEGPLPALVSAYDDFYNPFTGQPMFAGAGGYHAVAIIGYDEDRFGDAYWLAKNSWGALWGPTHDGIAYLPFGHLEARARTHALTGQPWVQHVPEPPGSLLGLAWLLGMAIKGHWRRCPILGKTTPAFSFGQVAPHWLD